MEKETQKALAEMFDKCPIVAFTRHPKLIGDETVNKFHFCGYQPGTLLYSHSFVENGDDNFDAGMITYVFALTPDGRPWTELFVNEFNEVDLDSVLNTDCLTQTENEDIVFMVEKHVNELAATFEVGTKDNIFSIVERLYKFPNGWRLLTWVHGDIPILTDELSSEEVMKWQENRKGIGSAVFKQTQIMNDFIAQDGQEYE